MKHKSLTIIIIAFTALASLYSFFIPLGEGPDEPGHVAYVFFLAGAGRLPDQRQNEVPGEGHQPPLAYALAAPLVAWLPRDERRIDLPANPRFTWAAPSRDAGPVRELNAVAHGSREFWPWSGAVLAWHMARLVSVALGAATVGLTFLTARAINCRLQIAECRLDQRQSTICNLQSAIPTLAAALVAFNPQFLFVSALVTNDALLTTLSAALLWLATRRPATDDRPLDSTITRVIAISTVLGLALITKQSAIILVPIACLSVLLHSWSAAGLRRDNGKQGVLSSEYLIILSNIALLTVITLAICGWWYGRNWWLYGDPFGLAVFQREFASAAFDARSPAAWLGALAQLHASFWARFGWMNVPAPGWVIWFFAVVEVAGLAGLLRYTLKNKETRKQGDKEMLERKRIFTPLLLVSWSPFLALPLLAFVWVASFALTAGLVAWQGRLLFPALPAIAIVLACGLAGLGDEETKRQGDMETSGFRLSLSPYLLVCALVALALWLPFGVIRPAYPLHTLPEEVALARLGTPTYGRLGLVGDPGAELRGWSIVGDRKPGAAPELTLIWHALGRQNRSWTVFIHLVDAGEQIVAQDNLQPQAGAFLMKQWVAGDWVEDRHALSLPAGLAPGAYELRVGLYDPRTGRRAAVFDRSGELLGDYVVLGQLQVK